MKENVSEKYRQEFRQELMALIQGTRRLFDGDPAHDSRMVHQAIINYNNTKRTNNATVKEWAEEYKRSGVVVEKIFYEECNRCVRLYCKNSDGSDDCLYANTKAYERMLKTRKLVFLANQDERLHEEITRLLAARNVVPKAGRLDLGDLDCLTDKELDNIDTHYSREKGRKKRREDVEAAKEALSNAIEKWTSRLRSIVSKGKKEACFNIAKGTKVVTKQALNEYQDEPCIRMPNSVTAIETNVFNTCHQMTSVVLSDRLESIGDWAFSWCLKLKSITLPTTLTHVGHNPFAVTHLTEVKSRSRRFVVADKALIDLKERRLIAYLGEEDSIDFEDGVLRQKKSTEPTTYVVPSMVTKIGRDSFRGRYHVKKLVISEQVVEIESNPIADSGIEEVECLSPCFKVVDGLLMSCDGKTVYANLCSKEVLNVPEGVTTVGVEAFLLSKQKEIHLPLSLTHYQEESMFLGADKLKRIVLPQGTEQQIDAP